MKEKEETDQKTITFLVKIAKGGVLEMCIALA